ncbi:hypothetical protein L810_6890 [Burkholderia sp. AU4i]|uniref:hypothetical protein n=1 Tax=Burkholderia sp. AU4i TaxID=1335308 RepID=UPI000398EB92|nr:hypothetical protein [Burkholderia sp. AU4i]ERJ38673.1 hypothetical protein L810_6890 [Burkholderia sp. AU4i]
MNNTQSQVVEAFEGYLAYDGIRIDVGFQAPAGATTAQKDVAFLAELAQQAEINYLPVGKSTVPVASTKPTASGFSTADADRLLGLADQFLEDWKETDRDDRRDGGADPELVERQAEYAAIRPLFVAAPEMFAAIRELFPSLELLPDGAFRLTVASNDEVRQWICIVRQSSSQWIVEHNFSTEQFEVASFLEGLRLAETLRASHIEDMARHANLVLRNQVTQGESSRP